MNKTNFYDNCCLGYARAELYEHYHDSYCCTKQMEELEKKFKNDDIKIYKYLNKKCDEKFGEIMNSENDIFEIIRIINDVHQSKEGKEIDKIYGYNDHTACEIIFNMAIKKFKEKKAKNTKI